MLTLHPIPAFQDNYLWLLYREGRDSAVVVDPGDALPVQEELKRRGLTLSAILVTHHHLDHTGGLKGLLTEGRVPVYGPCNAEIPEVSHSLNAGDRVEVLGEEFEVLSVPGHTMDHIAYFRPADEQDAPILLCGDTLFAGGCGRLFEGTPEIMWQSLERIRQLPPETRVYCAHEYTLDNLRFACTVEPENQQLAERWERERQRRAEGRPTLPSTIGLEQATNPFLRCQEETVRSAVAARSKSDHGQGPAAVFAEVRSWKDNF